MNSASHSYYFKLKILHGGGGGDINMVHVTKKLNWFNQEPL